jgi:chromosome segregation ATPase
VVVSYSGGSSNSYHASAPLPLVRTAEFPFNDTFIQLFEVMKLQLLQEMKLQLSGEIEPLSRRLDAEQTARDAQADELVKCQNNYTASVRQLERYQDRFANQQLQIRNLTQRSEQLESSCKASEEAKISEQTKCENLQQEYDRLCTRVQKLDNDNGELQSKVSSLEFDNAWQNADIDRVQSDLNKLQTERTELLHGLKETKEENLNMKKIVKALTQQKDNLQDEFENSQAENAKLHIEVARLVEAKGSLTEQVELLESECASLQEESAASDINPTQKSQGHLSTSTIDSGIGESLRDSVVSTRKRQISTSSIANEHEEKRHRSLQPLGDHDCGILFAEPDQDLDPLTLPIMGTSELPLPWNGSDRFAHTWDEGAEMTFI